MTSRLSTWKGAPGKPLPAGFMERFHAVGARAQDTYAAGQLTPPAYMRKLTDAVMLRPSEFLVAEHGGRDVARAAIFRSAHPEGSAAIGLYEADAGAPGDEATAMILDEALAWATDQGLRVAFAPVDVNTWFRYRFARRPASPCPPPFAWEPAQPDAYAERFRSAGFTVAETFDTTGFDFPASGPYTFTDLIAQTAEGHAAALDDGFRFERLDDASDLDAVLHEIHPVCIEAFRENPLFEPIPPGPFVAKYRDALASTPGHLSFVARDEEGLAGFMFAFADRGWIVIKTVAVAPHARGHRIASAFLHEVVRLGARAGLHKVITALVRNGNASRFLVDPQKMPTVDRWVRSYELLSRRVDPTSPL